MEPEIIPPAPEPQAPQEIEATPAAPADGYQKRIDELTQQLREKERQNQEAYKTVAELAARDAALAQRPPAPQAPEDPLAAYREKVDPTALEAMNKMYEALERKFQAQHRQLESSFGVRQIESAAAAAPHVPKEVVAEAQRLYQQARAAGSQATSDEALRFALGDYMLKGGKLNAPAAPAPQYGTGYAVLPGNAPQARSAAALPANFESLNRRAQLDILRARYENDPL